MDQKHLIKQNGVIVNTDNSEYERYIRERNKLKASKNESELIQTRLSKLENDVKEIKLLLTKMIGEK